MVLRIFLIMLVIPILGCSGTVSEDQMIGDWQRDFLGKVETLQLSESGQLKATRFTEMLDKNLTTTSIGTWEFNDGLLLLHYEKSSGYGVKKGRFRPWTGEKKVVSVDSDKMVFETEGLENSTETWTRANSRE